MTSRFGPRSLFGLLIPVLLLSTPPTGAQKAANDPAALITKMENVYRNATSFQGTITTRRSGKTREGKTFAMTGTRYVRFRAPNRLYDNQQFTGSGAAARMNQQSVLYVGDGKSLFVYQPSAKLYAQRPAPSSISLTQVVGRYLINTKNFTLSMGSATKVNGRDALVVMAKAKVPKEFPPNVKKEDQPKLIEEIKQQHPTQIFIDKRTYQLLRVSGGSPKVSDEIIFAAQAVNGAVPDSGFTFHAPPGTKLYAKPPGGSALPNQIK